MTDSVEPATPRIFLLTSVAILSAGIFFGSQNAVYAANSPCFRVTQPEAGKKFTIFDDLQLQLGPEDQDAEDAPDCSYSPFFNVEYTPTTDILLDTYKRCLPESLP